MPLDTLPKCVNYCKSRRAYRCVMKNQEHNMEFRLRLDKCTVDDIKDELLHCRSQALLHYNDNAADA